MIIELISVTALLVGGAAAVATAGIRGWPLLPLGLLAGVCLQSLVGLVQVVTPLTTHPALTLTVTAAAPLAWWLLGRRRGSGPGLRWWHPLPVLAGLVAVVALLRAVHLAKWHTDSLVYLMAGALLADDRYVSDVSTHMLTKRSLGLPLLHAPAHLAGEFYLRSVTALLALATLGALVWLLRSGCRPLPGRPTLALAAALGVLLLVTNNRFVFSMFYLNGHLLVAALLLLVAGGGWLLARRSPAVPARALMLLQLLAVPALVLARPEGTVMAGAALLPTWLAREIPLRHRAATMLALGGTNVVWQGFSAWIHLQRGAEIPVTVTGPLAVGILLLLTAPLLRWVDRIGRPTLLVWAAEAGLWLLLLALAVRQPALLRDSVTATAENVFAGAGVWGLSLVVLGVLVLGALIAGRFPERVFLRFPLTTFLPVAFLLAYLRDAPYRVGYGDSLARMFMHVVPLAVLYVIVAMTEGRPVRRRRTTAAETEPPRIPRQSAGAHDTLPVADANPRTGR